MFQDSVPAGSYNDPFLSSVCVLDLLYMLYMFYKSYDINMSMYLAVCFGHSRYIIGKSSINGQFSIAMLIYWRVNCIAGEFVMFAHHMTK